MADPDLVLDLILDPIPGLVQMDPGQVVLAVQVATRYGLRTSFLSTNQNRTSKNFILIIRLTEFQNQPEPEVPEQNSTTTQDFLSSWIIIPSVLVPSILLPALIVPLSNNGRFRVIIDPS